MKDAFSALRREYRELCPVARRRRHLVLVSAKGEEYTVRAIVRPDDRDALRPLIERLRSNGAHLRIAEADDGFLDADLLWRVGQRVDPERG